MDSAQLSSITRLCAPLILAWLMISVILPMVSAQDEQICRTTMECYYCDSEVSKGCADPFNFSYVGRSIRKDVCEKGCCIKWVENEGTDRQKITRSCTSSPYMHFNMQIAPTCMMDSSKSGFVCLCSNKLCNSAHGRLQDWHSSVVLSIVVALIVGTLGAT
ncbi:PREDICTED: protein quiver-like [Priapulus caudatus]|uniref:UPAR/Ly6 domain-containing protein qvr n=1 Tax=Priapulus caudatus TaxID=37621 RepID=A0ABM1EPG6_PRICU|nr:PREDICTED: protein quiver-like [Priapulus caudatus]